MSEKKFDSKQWKMIENGLHGENNRKKMLNDLVRNVLTFENIKNKGTDRKTVIELIGEPDSVNECNNYEIYYVEEKYGLIDPNGYINLNLEYNIDSNLVSWKIEEAIYSE